MKNKQAIEAAEREIRCGSCDGNAWNVSPSPRTDNEFVIRCTSCGQFEFIHPDGGRFMKIVEQMRREHGRTHRQNG